MRCCSFFAIRHLSTGARGLLCVFGGLWYIHAYDRGTAGWRGAGRLAVIMTLRVFHRSATGQTDEPCRACWVSPGNLFCPSRQPLTLDGRRAALDRRRKATVPHIVPKKAVGDGPDDGCLGGSRTKCGGQTLWAAASSHLVSCRLFNSGHCRAVVTRGNVGESKKY